MSTPRSLVLGLMLSAALSFSAQAEQTQTTVTPPGGYFSPSLPLNLETCAQTAAISQYLDSIAPDEIEKLKEIRTYLEGCQKLLEQRIAVIKSQIDELEAQDASTATESSAPSAASKTQP